MVKLSEIYNEFALFEKLAATDGIDIAELTEDEANALYAEYAKDDEKIASIDTYFSPEMATSFNTELQMLKEAGVFGNIAKKIGKVFKTRPVGNAKTFKMLSKDSTHYIPPRFNPKSSGHLPMPKKGLPLQDKMNEILANG